MNKIYYPSVERIIEFNALVLTLISVKKADQPHVLSQVKLMEVVDACKSKEGDIYDKAVLLLKGLIKKHAFASGNRRTAFLVVKGFLLENKAKFYIKDDLLNAKIMTGIRENYYSDEEIKEWIKNGKIKEFKREGKG